MNVPPEALEQANALARRLAKGGELPWAPVPDLDPGETGHAFWPTGTHAARFVRTGGSRYVPPASGGAGILDSRFPLIGAMNLLLRRGRRSPRRREWQLIAGGQPLGVIVTSHRLILDSGDTIPIAGISDVRPRARDSSAVEITPRTGDPLLLWGEHVPYLAILLAELVRRAGRPRSALPS